MKVCDYEIDYDKGGVFTCCEDHVINCEDEAHEGMVITCEHCESVLVLRKCPDGRLRWQGE
jgi:hypothetical protein